MVVDFILQKSELRGLAEKIEAGQRLETEDALHLFRTPDLNAIGRLATLATESRVGNQATYIVNRYINYSNYCILSCQFCSFARKKRDGDGFELTVEHWEGKSKLGQNRDFQDRESLKVHLQNSEDASRNKLAEVMK